MFGLVMEVSAIFFKVSIETNSLCNKNNGIFKKVSQFLSTSSDPVDSKLTISFLRLNRELIKIFFIKSWSTLTLNRSRPRQIFQYLQFLLIFVDTLAISWYCHWSKQIERINKKNLCTDYFPKQIDVKFLTGRFSLGCRDLHAYLTLINCIWLIFLLI